MKKLLLVLLVALLALTGCSTPADSGDNADETDAKVVEVGVLIYQFSDAFMTNYRNEIVSYFETLNTDEVTYNVTVQDGKGDQAEQTNQIDSFIAADVDVIIANLVQSSSASTVIEKCEAADIPVVFINREPTAEDMELWPGKTAYVGADASQSGKFQGEIIAELPNKGDINGDGVLSYAMLVGDPENVDAQQRTEYSISQYLEVSGLEVNKLFEERGDWQRDRGQELAANALTQYGTELEVIFANNDDMAVGAVQSIEAAGRVVGEDIYIVGVDALADAIDLINAGKMTGTVLNDHIGQSHTAVDVAIKAVNGESLDAYYWVDYVKVVAE